MGMSETRRYILSEAAPGLEQIWFTVSYGAKLSATTRMRDVVLIDFCVKIADGSFAAFCDASVCSLAEARRVWDDYITRGYVRIE